MGGDLGRTGGRYPKNLKWGRPMHLPPKIWRSNVIANTNRKKRKSFLCGIDVFVKKRVIYMCVMCHIL